MKKIKLLKPYTGLKTNIAFTINKSGVYLIYPSGSQKAVYIGMSQTNLYRTATRHFQSWEDPKQIRVTYPKQGYNIRIVLCTPLQAERLERALIVKYKPKDNPDKYLQYTLTDKDRFFINDFIDESAGDPPF
jgi:excinuclease UvrABC nuclease subunit